MYSIFSTKVISCSSSNGIRTYNSPRVRSLTPHEPAADPVFVWLPGRPQVRVEVVDERYARGDVDVSDRGLVDIIKPVMSVRKDIEQSLFFFNEVR